jgi:hypothetical protein
MLDEDAGTPAEKRSPCPDCGSMKRAVEMTISSTITAHSKLSLKGRHGGRGRPFIEQTVGDDLHRKSGKWMRIQRVIDRAKNWYREIVTDPQTGDVIHQCEEPLSDHQGHGTAKIRKKN